MHDGVDAGSGPVPPDGDADHLVGGDPRRRPRDERTHGRRGRRVYFATVEITDTLRAGHVTLPNGLGLAYPDAAGALQVRGVAPNELTASEDRDWIAGTPWHKHVPARVEAIPR